MAGGQGTRRCSHDPACSREGCLAIRACSGSPGIWQCFASTAHKAAGLSWGNVLQRPVLSHRFHGSLSLQAIAP